MASIPTLRLVALLVQGLLLFLAIVLALTACGRATTTSQVPPGPKLGRPDAVRAPLELPASVTVSTLPEQPPRIVISELFVDPLVLDDRAGEYIEMVNLSPHAVRVSDLSLSLPSGTVAPLDRAHDPVLHPGEVAIATARTTAVQQIHVPVMKLPNGAGRIELRWRNRVVDVAQWYGKKPWPKAHPGWSLERTRPDADGQTRVAWRASLTQMRVIERGSPGQVQWPCATLTNTPLLAACQARAKDQLHRRKACGPLR